MNTSEERSDIKLPEGDIGNKIEAADDAQSPLSKFTLLSILNAKFES